MQDWPTNCAVAYLVSFQRMQLAPYTKTGGLNTIKESLPLKSTQPNKQRDMHPGAQEAIPNAGEH
jgi:hypothetical protein